MSGNNATYGEKFTGGLRVAQEEINNAGGINGKKLELVIEDGVADPTKSLSAFRKIRQADDVQVVVTAFSSVIMAMAPVANEQKVVMVNPGAVAASLAKAGDYEFNVIPLVTLTVNKLAEHVYNNAGLKKAAIIYVNTDFGVSYKDTFKKRFEELGGQVVAEENYKDGDTDMRTQIAKIKAAKPQAIIFGTTGKSGGLIIRQIGELGINAKLFATQEIEIVDTVSAGGKFADGLVYVAPAFDIQSNDPALVKFKEEYQKKHNALPELYAANNYDALKLIAEAYKNGAKNGEDIKNFLYTVQNYDGASGRLSFDSDGNVTKPTILKTIQNGQFVKISQ